MHKYIISALFVTVLVTTLLMLATGCVISDNSAEWLEQHHAAINRKREVIFNNDGNEPFQWPTNKEFSVEHFLNMRTTPVLEGKVDTIFYCPISSGFGFLSANIPSADLMLRDISTVTHLSSYRNVLQEFLDHNTDPVKEIVKWSHANNYEIFVSLRVNDTHDMGTDQTQTGPPYQYPGNWLYSPFKIRHPEFLMGSSTNKTPHCHWSAVDFTHQEVRDHFYQLCREICEHYDLDGLDLDFFRHLQFFKSVAWGGIASDSEREMMTDTMRRIRSAAEEIGKKRRRPILLSIRVPDSVEYCRDIGLDLEQWLQEGLIDLVTGTGYWQFNPWEYLVALCQKYGVKCYASLDESRTQEKEDLHRRITRKDVATYRGQAMAALQAGVDGIMYFNMFSSDRIKKYMRGNMADIKYDDKRYHVTYRGINRAYARRYCISGPKRFSLQELTIHAPTKLGAKKSCNYPLYIGDDISELKKESIIPECVLVVNAELPENAELSVLFNNTPLALASVDGNGRFYNVPASILLCGKNQLEFQATKVSGKNSIMLYDAALELSNFKR